MLLICHIPQDSASNIKYNRPWRLHRPSPVHHYHLLEIWTCTTGLQPNQFAKRISHGENSLTPVGWGRSSRPLETIFPTSGSKSNVTSTKEEEAKGMMALCLQMHSRADEDLSYLSNRSWTFRRLSRPDDLCDGLPLNFVAIRSFLPLEKSRWRWYVVNLQYGHPIESIFSNQTLLDRFEIDNTLSKWDAREKM
jgi:hypothetical protein